jgi:RNA polymerase sigma-70 factor (ECF subfamily)
LKVLFGVELVRESQIQELEKLVRLSQQGDREAFAQLCELRRQQLVEEVNRKIDKRLLPRVDASDVIQEVFWDANRRLGEVIGNDVSLLAWMRFLCNQKLVDMHRTHMASKKRSINREVPRFGNSTGVGSLAERLIDGMTSPSMRFQKDEVVEKVKVMLNELSPIDREIIVMRHYHSMSNKEVAESLGLSINAASNRYVRALKRFKTIFDTEME